MNVYTLWKKYPESYPGEMMPNVYEAADEYLNDDNPAYLNDAIQKAKEEVAAGDIVAYRVIVLRFDDDVIHDAFADPRVTVDAEAGS